MPPPGVAAPDVPFVPEPGAPGADVWLPDVWLPGVWLPAGWPRRPRPVAGTVTPVLAAPWPPLGSTAMPTSPFAALQATDPASAGSTATSTSSMA